MTALILSTYAISFMPVFSNKFRNNITLVTYKRFFSPVCPTKCILNVHLLAKCLSHWLHLNGFSPECTLGALVWSLANVNTYMSFCKDKL